ncbi:Lon proteolytic domain-containing protein [Caenorhabditis elegans]|uniref:Lon proteolytic domain-containing protein n=1 Tax=Caenorhabditis elegans TaxID=6239 RepID=Q9TXY0_CAEEL|nr:Lon proteolytic domain-containing protein [Caenorhabditis elegans]CCD70098.2 Lon proteolytic domain-containing protein [Caenorhabditis elegans]
MRARRAKHQILQLSNTTPSPIIEDKRRSTSEPTRRQAPSDSKGTNQRHHRTPPASSSPQVVTFGECTVNGVMIKHHKDKNGTVVSREASLLTIECDISPATMDELVQIANQSQEMAMSITHGYAAAQHYIRRLGDPIVPRFTSIRYVTSSRLRGPSGVLATALSVIFAVKGWSMPHDILVTGSLGTGGKVEMVGSIKEKVKLARNMNMTAIVPLGNLDEVPKMLKDEVITVSSLKEAVEIIRMRIGSNDISC